MTNVIKPEARLPDRNLLVLDLDGTLVYADHKPLPVFDFVLDPNIRPIYVKKRPYLDYFLGEARKGYGLFIWTAGSARYSQEVIENLGLAGLIMGCFSRDHCTRRFERETREEYLIKRLRKIRRDLSKVLIVDDSPRKCEKNYGNAIYINEFNGQEGDRELFYLALYLRTIKNAENFRKIDKRGWRKKTEALQNA